MLSSSVSFLGTIIKKPAVGFGVVGQISLLILLRLISLEPLRKQCSFEMQPSTYLDADIAPSKTFLKDSPSDLKMVCITCLEPE